MEKIAIIGSGLMGCGIAAVFAASGHDVAVYDAYPDALARAPERIAGMLATLAAPAAAKERLTFHNSLQNAVYEASYVTEAAPERLELKQQIFAELDALTPPECTLASNTSVIPIGDIACKARNASRILGTHWWNPPYLIPLVEVVQASGTELRHVERTIELLRSVGKTAVHVKRDVPGFVGNRLQHALWREAISIVAAGICDAETVDLVVKNSFGVRLPVLGPLENADLVGLDLTLDIHNVILRHLESSGDPSPLLRDHVEQGRLGMKSGEGFYSNWTPEAQQRVRARLTEHLLQVIRPAASAHSDAR